MWQSYSLVFFTKTDARGNLFGCDSFRILTTFQNGDHETYEKKDISQMTEAANTSQTSRVHIVSSTTWASVESWRPLTRCFYIPTTKTIPEWVVLPKGMPALNVFLHWCINCKNVCFVGAKQHISKFALSKRCRGHRQLLIFAWSYFNRNTQNVAIVLAGVFYKNRRPR